MLGEPLQSSEKKKEEKRNWNPLNIISYLQEDSAKFLKLTHQMDGIDYLAENLKRGDSGALEFLLWTIQNGDVVEFILDAGRERVALFFGAAHLPDLGEHLEKDFGLKLQPETRWFKAWNLEKIEE